VDVGKTEGLVAVVTWALVSRSIMSQQGGRSGLTKAEVQSIVPQSQGPEWECSQVVWRIRLLTVVTCCGDDRVQWMALRGTADVQGNRGEAGV
jgi:hypothetical protein